MRPEVIAALLSAAIPFLGGVYATLLGYRLVGKKPGQDERYDAWYARNGGMLRSLGPFVALGGVFIALRAL